MNSENMVTVCEKIKITQIYSPIDNWNNFHQIYNILQKEVISSSNKIMSVCNIYNSFETKEEKNDWLLKTFNSDKIRNVLYQLARNNCRYSYSKNANAVSNDINSKYFSGVNSYSSKIKKGIGNPPMTFTETIPLYTTVQGYKVECVDYNKGYYTIDIPLLNQESKNGIAIEKTSKNKDGKFVTKKEILQVNNTHLKFGVNAGRNKRLTEVLDSIMNGTYKFGDSKLKRVESSQSGRKYDYYFLLSYSKPAKEHTDLSQDNILGVDLGIVVPAYCAVNYCDYKRKSIGDTRIIRQNKIQENINRKMQKNIKYNLRDGKGRNYKLDGFDGNSNKIANRNNTYNFNIAKEIIDNAIKWQCGVIHMEDLTGISATRPDDRFLKSWTYYDLQQKIENKAKENGIAVRYINPYRTSQTCSKCGNHEQGQRTSQATFICKSCGYKVNADYNAARNISMSTAFVKGGGVSCKVN